MRNESSKPGTDSKSKTDRIPRTDEHDTLPFDPAAAVCEELLVFVEDEDEEVGPDGGDELAPDRACWELPDVTPVAASAVVDVEVVIDYEQELGYLRAEGVRGFSARRAGSRRRPAGPRAG